MNLHITLRSARHMVVFTGAGVSAESGVPTFRDALTGLWARFDAAELATAEAFAADPELVWGWYEWRRAKVMAAQPIRPGVVWFGESLPEAAWQAAVAAAEACDVLFSIGTSALVHPAAELPVWAARRGAAVIQVNPHATALDAVARFNLRGPAGEVLPALFSSTWG